jgi:hypothetical protein
MQGMQLVESCLAFYHLPKATNYRGKMVGDQG